MTDQTGHPASRAAGDHQLFRAEPHTANEIDRAEEEAESTGTPPKNLLDGMVKALRPRQWVKNVLVIAAPAAAGTQTLTDTSVLFSVFIAFVAFCMAASSVYLLNAAMDVAAAPAHPAAAGTPPLTDPSVLFSVFIAFVAFCMAASSVYLINDAMDVEADRAHPTKRYRPIAAGVLPVGLAYAMAAVLIVASLAISVVFTHPALAIVVAVYIVLQLMYCFGLKHQPVLDIAFVSSGFLLRAVAGGAAAEVAISQWFLLVMAFGSLFMAAGKRYAE